MTVTSLHFCWSYLLFIHSRHKWLRGCSDNHSEDVLVACTMCCRYSSYGPIAIGVISRQYRCPAIPTSVPLLLTGSIRSPLLLVTTLQTDYAVCKPHQFPYRRNICIRTGVQRKLSGRGERGTSVHGADTFTAVFGKTIGSRCSRKCKIIPSLADYRSTYEVTRCLQPHWKKSQICVLRALSKLLLKINFSWSWLKIRVLLYKIHCK